MFSNIVVRGGKSSNSNRLLLLFLLCRQQNTHSSLFGGGGHASCPSPSVSSSSAPSMLTIAAKHQNKRQLSTIMAEQNQQKTVLVYGGRGALGAAVVAHFKRQGVFVVSVDLGANEAADANICVRADQSWTDQETHILNELGTVLSKKSGSEEGKPKQLDAVLCVAGGWAGGNAASSDFIKNLELMTSQSVLSSALAARIAAQYLRPGGLLQLTGAAAAVHGTPGMIAYGMAKAAVHQMTKSLAGEKSGLPDGASVLTILPITLDTPMNRKWMPKADHSKWTPLEWVAERLFKWTYDESGSKERPSSGSLLVLKTVGGETTMEPVPDK